MKAVIIGDIIDSRKSKTFDWLDTLKKVLSVYGKSPSEWEIFRGDSFQLMIEPEMALLTAYHIKAEMKSAHYMGVRIAVGVGGVDHQSAKITESNGEAFVLSGSCFEALKKQTLGLKTPDAQIDQALNVMLRLARLTVDGWSATVGKVVTAKIEQPQKSQKELAALLGKSQSSISEALKRSGFDEIMMLDEFYRQQIACL